MSVSDSAKLDYLWKKVGYGVTKTAPPANKEAFNESIPSPLIYRGDLVMVDSGNIPAIIPTTTSDIVQIYKDNSSGNTWSATVECTEDLTAPDNQTWKTNLQNWVPTQFGSTYLVKVYVANAGVVNPQTVGTQLFQAGSGNNDEWFFDYQSGVLNFNGANIPSVIGTGVTGKSVYISGARYVGEFGVSGSNSLGNLTIANTTITSDGTIGNIRIQPTNGVANALWTFDSTGNLTLPSNTFTVNYANGTPVSIGGSDYSNANVQAYLPLYEGDLDNVDSITTVGNVTVGTGAFFIGDGGLLSNVASAYGNANVANYLPTYTGNLNAVNYLTANVISSNATIIANSVTLGTTVTPVSVSQWAQVSTASVVPVVLMTIDASTVTHIDFNVVATDAAITSRQVSKLMAINYNGSVDYNEYGSLLIGTTVGDFTVTTDGTDIFLNVIPISSTTVDYNVVAMIYY